MLLDNRSKEPIYQQLKQKLTEQIGQGILKPNEQLPPVRTLARDLGVNPNTVQRAYTELEQSGIIYQIVGKGSFVSPEHNVSNQLINDRLKKIEAELISAKSLGILKPSIVTILDKVYEVGEMND